MQRNSLSTFRKDERERFAFTIVGVKTEQIRTS